MCSLWIEGAGVEDQAEIELALRRAVQMILDGEATVPVSPLAAQRTVARRTALELQGSPLVNPDAQARAEAIRAGIQAGTIAVISTPGVLATPEPDEDPTAAPPPEAPDDEEEADA